MIFLYQSIFVPVSVCVKESIFSDGAEDHDVGHDHDDGRGAVAEDPEPFFVELTSWTKSNLFGRIGLSGKHGIFI